MRINSNFEAKQAIKDLITYENQCGDFNGNKRKSLFLLFIF